VIRVAIDTNILAYAEGVNGEHLKDAALHLLQRQLAAEATLLPVQSLGELYRVLVKKAGRSAFKARAAVLTWGDAFPLIETSPAIMLSAMDLAVDHRFTIWDAVILAAAADENCRLLLSEDLQDGFTWRGVTVTNPFAKSRHRLLDALLEGA
jgi:predicted nucleic acid-binding protein